ncbi:MAG: helix-turn-helix domain-containing protein [Verrucomicrobiaceae bacterium]|nr:MAG: helix-turn-helix domain-containing protein [Verrucomicrobiaceae bacterium]
MNKKYRIHLSPEQRLELEKLVAAGKVAVTKRQRAQILLATDEDHPGGALPDRDAARAFDVSVSTVERTRRALIEHGLKIAVQGRPTQRKSPRAKVDDHIETQLAAAACGPPPDGRRRWTLRLLGDRMVALGLIDSLSPQTVNKTLKKKGLKLCR